MTTTLISTLDADRKRAVENVREAANRIWARPLHRYYTDHTVTHSERIIALLDGLTAGMMGTDKRLAPGEVFILLVAAYLHDIGMQDERYAEGDLDEIRSDHHELSAELIYRAVEDPAQAVSLGLPNDPSLVEAVALVAKGHRKVDLGAAEYEPLVHGGETLRLRLLAALLRFGDELDIDHRRVDLEMMKLVKLPVESQLHWWKCHYVSGVSIVDEYIKIAYRFPQDRPDYEGLIVPLVEGDVRKKLGELEEIFRANAVKVAVGKSSARLMRLVQAMPAEVEALARKDEGRGMKAESKNQETSGKVQEARGKKRATSKKQQATSSKQRAANASSQPPATVFDQRGQTVGTQINVAGDYVAQPPESHITSAELRWNTEAVRDLLSAAFDDGELTTLCFDHFRAVYEDFAAGMSKSQKIQSLLDYCSRHEQFERLTGLVQARNPAQYARYVVRLPRSSH